MHRYPRSAERRLSVSALPRKDGLSVCVRSPDGAHSDESTPDASQAIYAEFDDDFEDEELAAPIGKCTAMYNFPGMSSEYPSRSVGIFFLMHFFSAIKVPAKGPYLCRRGRCWLLWKKTKEMAGHASVGTTAMRATYPHLMSPFLLPNEEREKKRFTS